MTTEEKAKAYDEALEKIKEGIKPLQDGKEISGVTKGFLEEVFPELKESEDERIRKELIEFVKSRGGFKQEYIAWLEKQGEQKLFDYENANIQQKDFAPKVEPKFKVGDWVVYCGKPYQITGLHNDTFTLTSCNGSYFFNNVKSTKEPVFHLWTIQDAKDGDVLCCENEISLYKHDIKNCTKQETTFGGFVYHCCYDSKRFITDSLYSLTEQDKMNIHPATKEQRDLLFQKMKDAGYEWDADKKELIR